MADFVFKERLTNRAAGFIFFTLITLVLTVFALSYPKAISAYQSADEPDAAFELSESADAAVKWLAAAHQNDDGGYSSFSIGAGEAPSDASGTADALLAIGAAGGDVSEPLNFLKSHLDEVIAFTETDGSAAGKVVLALVKAGEDPRDFGHDFVRELQDHLSSEGHFGVESAFGNGLAILGLEAAGEQVPESALDWLRDHQEVEGEFSGSWDDGFGTAGNPDGTAMALIALLAGGIDADDDVITNAESFLIDSQLPSAGWEYGQGFGENANSTALVIRALVALDQDPNDEESRYSINGRTPVDVLLSWQGQSGAFQADFGGGPADDFFASVQSIPAISDTQTYSTKSESDLFGGDSILPFLMLGLVAVVFIVIVVWFVRSSRSGA